MGVSSSGTVAALQCELAQWLSGVLTATVEQVGRRSTRTVQGFLFSDPSRDQKDR